MAASVSSTSTTTIFLPSSPPPTRLTRAAALPAIPCLGSRRLDAPWTLDLGLGLGPGPCPCLIQAHPVPYLGWLYPPSHTITHPRAMSMSMPIYEHCSVPWYKSTSTHPRPSVWQASVGACPCSLFGTDLVRVLVPSSGHTDHHGTLCRRGTGTGDEVPRYIVHASLGQPWVRQRGRGGHGWGFHLPIGRRSLADWGPAWLARWR